MKNMFLRIFQKCSSNIEKYFEKVKYFYKKLKVKMLLKSEKGDNIG